MRAAAECGRELRMKQAPVGDDDVEQRVEAVVEEDLGVEDHDQVDPDEHLEHRFREVEVHRPHRLRVGAGPVEERLLALAPDRQLHLVGPVAEPVVVDPVLERLGLLRDRGDDQLRHRLVGAVEEGLAGRQVGLLSEALAELVDALLGGAAAGDDPHQVGPVHLGHADVVQDHAEDVRVQLAFPEDLHRRDADALAEDRLRPGRQRARQRAARVHLVAEHAGPADQLTFPEDRQADKPVVDVRDRAAALVRVGVQDHVALADRLVEVLEHLRDVGAELADHHPAVAGR